MELTYLRFSAPGKSREEKEYYLEKTLKYFRYKYQWELEGELEVQTPKLKNIKEFSRWYDKFETRIIYPFKLKTHIRPYTRKGIRYYEGTGGGHVHVELPQKLNQRRFFQRFLKANKYLYFLKWVLGDICEDYIARPNENINIYFDKEPSSLLLLSDYGTLEHRYFDAPRNQEEAINYIEFALALTNMICDKNWIDNFYLTCFDYDKRNNSYHIEVCFRLLIGMLDLSWEDYKKYLKNYIKCKRIWGSVD